VVFMSTSVLGGLSTGVLGVGVGAGGVFAGGVGRMTGGEDGATFSGAWIWCISTENCWDDPLLSS
jgi:hypothetical protein